MEELTATLAASFNVTQEPNNTAAQHPRYAQYKQETTVDQETRRKRILEEQKK
jgi:snurportin-1